MTLDVLTRDDCQQVRHWRNAIHDLGMLRTSRRLTEAEQDAFFADVVSNPSSVHRYYAVRYMPSTPDSAELLKAMVGLTHIDVENGAAEISLIVSPTARRQGIGAAAVQLVLAEAFDRLRLLTVYGEVYHCNEPGMAFWTAVAGVYHASIATLQRRKFWNGQLYDAMYFSIARESFLPSTDGPRNLCLVCAETEAYCLCECKKCGKRLFECECKKRRK